MRIGIDYTPALSQRAGIGRFTRELVKALLCLDHSNDYLLLHHEDGRGAPPLPGDNARFKHLPFTQRFSAVMWQRLRIPIPAELFTGHLDIFHATDYLLPPLRGAKGIATVHDLSFLIHPECADPSLVAYLKSALPRSLKHAHLVLTDSYSARDDLVLCLGFPKEKVEVVHGAVSEEFSPVSDPSVLERVRQRHGLFAPFILSLGTLEPRKNLATLIQAYAFLRRERGIDHRLVVAGGKGWMYEDIFSLVRELGLEEEVSFLGYLADEDLPALLSMAEVFAFPSLYEGFGLPPLEAMACGTPVVASNTSSMPEVLGDAALLVEPKDPSALAKALHRVLTEADLREKLRARGLARATEFSWEVAAQKLLTIYQRVHKGM